MPAKTAENTRYPVWLARLHWLVLILLVAAYALMELRGFAERGSELRSTMRLAHYLVGLGVLGLALWRLGLRLRGPLPAALAGPRWEQLASRAGHYALYAWMLAMPLIGWALISAEQHLPTLFGWQLPAIAPASESLAERLEELHEWLATAGYLLIGGHVLAALWHQWLRGEAVFARIRPTAG